MGSTNAWRPIAVLCCSYLACSACSVPEEQTFDSSASPNGRYTVTVTVTEPWIPHGRFKITAYVADEETGVTERIVTRTLENDGVPFTGKNIALRWISEHIALICLRSTDLRDEGIRITVNGKAKVEVIAEC